MVSTVLWALIGGTIIGFLGKTFAPGKRDIALWLTILIGIGGIFIGNWAYTGIWGDDGTRGLDWWRHIWQVAAAALLVVLLTSSIGRKKSSS